MSEKHDYWNTSNFTFQNFNIHQKIEIPSDATKLIMFVNQEDRAMGILSKTKEELGNLKTVYLIILNKEFENHESSELKSLIAIVAQKTEYLNLDLQICYFDFYSEEFSTDVYKEFSKYGIFEERVLLDITCCPPVVMIQLSEVLLSHQNHTLTFIYSFPELYDIKLIQEIGNKEASNADIREYGKIEKDKTVLTIVAGFEDKKARQIAEFVDPDYGYLFNNIFDEDLTQSALAKTTMKLHKELLKLENYKQFHLPRFDVYRMLNTFEIIGKTKSNHNLVMACFGSKIQRLAVMLYVSRTKNRMIVDLIPEQLNFSKISIGYKESIYYSIRRTNL